MSGHLMIEYVNGNILSRSVQLYLIHRQNRRIKSIKMVRQLCGENNKLICQMQSSYSNLRLFKGFLPLTTLSLKLLFVTIEIE